MKYFLRNTARQAIYWWRARGFHEQSGNADVLHFQQILNALGSVTVFHWLRMPSRAARVVTVHELDEHQRESPASNLTYNQANRIIVFCQEMKQSLVDYGVRAELVDVIEHGTAVEEFEPVPRTGIVYYGGHHFGPNKGFDTLARALAAVRARRGSVPELRVHGHYGTTVPDFALQLAKEHGLQVTWLNRIPLERERGRVPEGAAVRAAVQRQLRRLPGGDRHGRRRPRDRHPARRAAGPPGRRRDLGSARTTSTRWPPASSGCSTTSPSGPRSRRRGASAPRACSRGTRSRRRRWRRTAPRWRTRPRARTGRSGAPPRRRARRPDLGSGYAFHRPGFMMPSGSSIFFTSRTSRRKPGSSFARIVSSAHPGVL